MTLRLFEGRHPITDLEITIEKLRRDIEFYTLTTFHNVDMKDAEEKLREYEDALEKLKDKHGKRK
jgi:hypothetical protein